MPILQSVLHVIRIHGAVFYLLFLSMPCPFLPHHDKTLMRHQRDILFAAAIQQSAFLFNPTFCLCFVIHAFEDCRPQLMTILL